MSRRWRVAAHTPMPDQVESGGTFELHERLAADCHQLGRVNGCHLLLHRDAALHWFILVPETDHLDLLDLPAYELTALMNLAASLSWILKGMLGYPRVNFGAIGNLVPQMHLHVVGRQPGDACWPAPVWGNLASGETYSDSQLTKLKEQLTDAIGLDGAE